MEWLIYIVEDVKVYFQLYNTAITSLQLSERLTVLSKACTQEIDFSEFVSDLRNQQPDIIFLDYELEWKSSAHYAPAVIQTIKDVYNVLNFPPLIILNTRKEKLRQSMYNLLNFSDKKYSIPLGFVMTITAEAIDEGGNDLRETLTKAIQVLKDYRQPYDWEKEPGITFYPYPDRHINHGLNIENKTFFTFNHWLKPQNKLQLPPFLNRLNLLLIVPISTYGEPKKDKNGKLKSPSGRIGCMFYFDNNYTIHKSLFTFETKKGIENCLSLLGELSPFKTKRVKAKGEVYYNSIYLDGGSYLHFKKDYHKIEENFFAHKNEELLNNNLTEYSHLFYSQLTKIT